MNRCCIDFVNDRFPMFAGGCAADRQPIAMQMMQLAGFLGATRDAAAQAGGPHARN